MKCTDCLHYEVCKQTPPEYATAKYYSFADCAEKCDCFRQTPVSAKTAEDTKETQCDACKYSLEECCDCSLCDFWDEFNYDSEQCRECADVNGKCYFRRKADETR